jgi:protease-4
MRLFRLLLALPLICLFAGCGTPSLLITPVQNTSSLQAVVVQRGSGWSRPKIAIIEVEGMLLNARTGGFLQPSENKVSLFAQQLNAAAADDSVKAVVLRINSPGGTVTASDTMYQMLVDFKQKTRKPVLASTQDVAASGAYYIACGADKIVAHPTSVVGSIGVIFNTFDVEQAMQKIGVRNEAIKSAPLKDMGSLFKKLTPAEREVMQKMVDEFYGRFVTIVKSNRTITDPDRLALVTDGRVFSGTEAVRLGLADTEGTLEDALKLAKELAKAPNADVILYKRPYGYTGSIYADTATPLPQSNVLQVEMPGSRALLPTGFYYIWEPG